MDNNNNKVSSNKSYFQLFDSEDPRERDVSFFK
jgi:hypothetical protein